MTSIIEARRAMDRAILADMNNLCVTYERFETFHSLRSLGHKTFLSRDMTRAICRDLTDRGFAQYARGLFNEDGVPAGSGYGITPRGLAYLTALEEVDA